MLHDVDKMAVRMQTFDLFDKEVKQLFKNKIYSWKELDENYMKESQSLGLSVYPIKEDVTIVYYNSDPILQYLNSSYWLQALTLSGS